MSLPTPPSRDEGPFPLELILPSLVDDLESTIGGLRGSLRLLAQSPLPEGGGELLAIASRQVERQEAVLREIVALLGAELEWCRQNGPDPGEPSDAARALEAAATIVRALAPRARLDVAPPSAATDALLARCALLPLTRAAHCLLVAALARSADACVSAVARRSGDVIVIDAAFQPREGAFSTEAAGQGPERGSSPAGLEACASLAARCGGRVSVADGGRLLRLEVAGA